MWLNRIAAATAAERAAVKEKMRRQLGAVSKTDNDLKLRTRDARNTSAGAAAATAAAAAAATRLSQAAAAAGNDAEVQLLLGAAPCDDTREREQSRRRQHMIAAMEDNKVTRCAELASVTLSIYLQMNVTVKRTDGERNTI